MKTFIIFIFCVFLLAPAALASQKSMVKKGNSSYKKGDFDSAVKNYENALKFDQESPEVNYNLGTALYKNKKYSDAVPFLQKGLLSENPSLKKNAHFNLGNALLGAGLGIEKQNLDQALNALEDSLRQFESAIKLDDKDKDAQYNYDIVKKELDRLRKKKKEQNKQQSQNQNQKQNQNEDQNQNTEQNQSQENNQNQKDQSSGSDSKEQNPKNSENNQDGIKEKQDDQGGKNEKEALSPGQMRKEEAKELLKQFEQNEQPDRLLNFGKKRGEDRPVLKDW